ncbi:MAG: efflux RND transporter permease subunit [Phycisphaerales bacterium]|nr:efflux RND transporter permease subunit [Phycisphaerales bacterium]
MGMLAWCISRPVTVSVGVFLLVMAGLISLRQIPVQLTPTVSRPVITVTTNWPGRSPQEIIDEITKEQEEFLKNIAKLDTMASTTSEGQTDITLTFLVGSDITRALQEVSDALRQVPDYPDEVTEPQIVATDGAGSASGAIAWIILDFDDENLKKHAGYDLTTLYDALDKEVKPYMERIEGVAQVNIYGGREREARVLTDPVALAQRGLNHVNVIQALQGENQNVSAGSISEGKREYRVRLIGRYTSPDQILSTIIAYRDGLPVYVRDVAEVEIGYTKRRGFIRSLARPAIAINVIRQDDANVIDIMTELKKRLSEIETDILPNIGGSSAAGPIGPDLRLRQVYDETIYITSAISLVTQNLWVGGLIAAFVLLIFLRSWRATGIIAIAIPISVIGTFLVLLALGRTLNVVSLAGLAFAVGMVVDNSIVVLENIDRRIGLGESPMRAALRGGGEVWGAILASTLTTIAVFIPVLTISEEAGQLFRDIAIAIVVSVSLSLIVSVFVIPTACSRWLKPEDKKPSLIKRAVGSLFGLTAIGNMAVSKLGDSIRFLITGVAGWTLRPLLIVVMATASVLGAFALMPPMDYLPAGNRNLVFGGLLIPPGLSLDQRVSIAERIEGQIVDYAEASIDDPDSYKDLPDIQMFPGMPIFDPVPVDNFFIGAFGTGMFIGATSEDPEVVIPVGHLLTSAMNTIPDSYGGAGQTSLFGQFNSGGSIRLQILGPNLDRVNNAATFMLDIARPKFGGSQASPDPANFSIQQQEMQVVLNDLGRELGLTNQGLGVAVRGLFDGAFVGDYTLGSEAIDLVVVPIGGELDYLEQLADIPIATPAGPVVPVQSVVEFIPTSSPQTINRIEELPSVTINITPPESMALQDAMNWIDENMIEKARELGNIDSSMRVKLEGSAADLQKIQSSMFGVSENTTSSGRPSVLIGAGVGIATLLLGLPALLRSVRARNTKASYGIAGILLMSIILGVISWTAAGQPQLISARMVWAILVTYLLMCALFESFLYPFVILLTVPLAVVGGFAGLKIVHEITLADPTKAPQQLDVLTMLGFVILIGVVVNNAILLVHQALNFMRGESDDNLEQDDSVLEPMNAVDAIVESVKTRTRPILMSVMTSVGGMLPLVLVPGSGSEMYRGLGSVVVGGLLVSTIFTLLLVPLLFSLVMDMRQGLTPSESPTAG